MFWMVLQHLCPSHWTWPFFSLSIHSFTALCVCLSLCLTLSFIPPFTFHTHLQYMFAVFKFCILFYFLLSSSIHTHLSNTGRERERERLAFGVERGREGRNVSKCECRQNMSTVLSIRRWRREDWELEQLENCKSWKTKAHTTHFHVILVTVILIFTLSVLE